MSKKIDYLFVAFPSFLAESDELTPQDKAVLLYLCSAISRNWNPSYRELTRHLGLGNSTIRKTILKLQLFGFIAVKKGKQEGSIKNEINDYFMNMNNPERWSPTMRMREGIISCYEINKRNPPDFKNVYSDIKALLNDLEQSLEKGRLVQENLTTVDLVEASEAKMVPLNILNDYERAKEQFKRMSRWDSMTYFIMWLKGNRLSLENGLYFRELYIQDELTGDKFEIIRQIILTADLKSILEMIEIEKKKILSKEKTSESI